MPKSPSPRLGQLPGLLLAVLLVAAARAHAELIEPEQVMLRPAADPESGSRRVAVWVTFATPNTTTKEYLPFAVLHELERGRGEGGRLIAGKTVAQWSCHGLGPRVHVVKLENLDPERRYSYTVGNNRFGWSPSYDFVAPPHPHEYRKTKNDGEPAFRAATYGDMGIEYSWGTTRTLGRWARDDRLDQILHVGDISYADDRIHLNNGTFYQGILNYFYNVVSSYGAKVSYATTPGNHEASCNFNDYLGRNPTPFIESGSPSSMFYAFTNQRVRFIATSTEEHERNPKPHNEDYFNQQGAQYKWLKAQLEDASRARAAGEIDWIIGMGHRPMYCSFNWSACCWENCHSNSSDEWINTYRVNIEDLFHEHKMDLWLSGHTHNYERTFPTFHNKPHTKPGDSVHEFHDPEHTIWIQAGAPGDMEVMEHHHWLEQPKWTARRFAAWENNIPYARAGFGHIQIYNSTHLRFDFIQSSTENSLDHFWIKRSEKS